MSQQVKVYRQLTLEPGRDGESARILAGDSTTSVSYTAGTPPVALYFTDDNTSTTSSEPFYLKSTMTGTSGCGGRSRFHMYTNVTLGGWSNALKAYAQYGTSGRTSGLGSALCVEMYLPNTNIVAAGGAYFPLEIEHVSGGTSLVTAGALTGNHTGFIYMEASGDANGDFDDNGFLAQVVGLTAGTGHIFQTGANTGTIAGSLKIGVGTTAYYIPLWSNEVQA